MSHESPQIDVSLAHRHFSVDCFNRVWTLIEKPDRTPADHDAMVLCALASLWHWTQRLDCTPLHLSVGHWQISRAYALNHQGENAALHAQKSLVYAKDLPGFYAAYAHEAAARAALILGNTSGYRRNLEEAMSGAAAVADAEDRAQLERDLSALAAAGRTDT